jgi:hypothetical protein
MLRKYTSITLTATLGIVGVLWVMIGAFQLMNILLFFPTTNVSLILYFLVAVVIGICVRWGVVYANAQATIRRFFYEEVPVGLIVGHTFIDEGKYTRIVHVNFVGKNRMGQVRRDTAAIDAKNLRQGVYAIGQEVRFE